MKPRRIAIKFFCEEGGAVDLPAAISLFHRVIQEQAVEGLLVDVADYIHVPDGPGVILVGHEIEYSLDATDGRPGLLTTAKRLDDTSLSESLPTTLRRALVAAQTIETDGSTGARFDTRAFDLHILDRLAGPNDPASYALAEKELASLLGGLPGGADFAFERTQANDPRKALAVSARSATSLEAAAVIEALGGVQHAPVAGATPAQSPWDISVEELARLREAGSDFELVDVREPDEYARANLGGRLIPLGELAERMGELDRGAHVVVHCKVGGRGAKATQLLREAGFENAWNVNGGLAAWASQIDPSLELD